MLKVYQKKSSSLLLSNYHYYIFTKDFTSSLVEHF